MRESPHGTQSQKARVPAHPIISDSLVKSVSQRDTLDRVASIIALLQELEFSEGISVNAGTGLYWILAMLEDTVKYVSDSSVVND